MTAAWLAKARCRDEPNLHFDGEEGRTKYGERIRMRERARRMCHECPVYEECLTEVTKIERRLGLQEGIWAGRTKKERAKLLRQSAA